MSPGIRCSLWVVLCLIALCHVDAHPHLRLPEHDPIPAIKGLISRTLGPQYNSQVVVTAKDERGHDVSSFDEHNGRVRVSGSSATAIGFALHKYLKDVVHTQADWDNHALVVPAVLPLPPSAVTIAKNTKFTYYLNVVTTSYSFWTWDWPQWAKHIDWMALQGITLPLAFTGQEKIWLETFKKYNVSTAGMQHFFAGAAFQAWGRMGNVRDSWGPFGPIPLDFIEDQYRLQLRILDRMKEFGMLPALPAFAGHVPAELVTLYPHANVRQSSQWANFPEQFTCVHMLDPTDPLYLDIGRTFIQVQTQLYGGYTSSVYQTDTYNELLPHTSDPAYLRASSKAVIDSMLAADPNAVWIMQGWLFYFMKDFWTNDKIEAYLGGVANDRLIMLDLWTESFPVWSRTSNYFGKPWIYCLLHTFGGNLGLHGNLPKLATNPITSLAASDGHMIGLGLTMEGIFQNYVVYDLALEMAWRSTPMPLDKWVQAYVHQRYHVENEHATKAWAFLKTSVYRDEGLVDSVATTRPRWQLAVNETDVDGNLLLPKRVSSDAVSAAWTELVLAGADSVGKVDAFQHDLVDVTRQVLNNVMVEYYTELVQLYLNPKTSSSVVCSKADQILDLLHDMDTILATSTAFLLGRWIRDAKARGTPATAGYFEYQARNQLTRWGVGTLNDYANKQWAGLVGEYYAGRWRVWLNAVCDAREAGLPTDDAKIDGQINDFEVAWQTQTNEFPTDPVGDSVEIATKLHAKYGTKQHRVLDLGIPSSTKDDRKTDLPWSRRAGLGTSIHYVTYGATGAGKTHTMMGSERDGSGDDNQLGHHDDDDDNVPHVDGIIPHALTDIFRLINSARADEEDASVAEGLGFQWSVVVTYLEVYNEQIRDLLNPSSRPLALREDPVKGVVHVAGLHHVTVETSSQVLQLLRS
ncbi:hypothetical protein DYB38_010858 [Aphanomyces astaci]|uniref:Kinesin motor domain-containing protein n=1 Tax=Aphanomyces astaci TaxID=112090 RepID=A0A397DE47_APHAT|nr:hypothetical protein DYB38_010858 [Aphanomyces astaci]